MNSWLNSLAMLNNLMTGQIGSTQKVEKPKPVSNKLKEKIYFILKMNYFLQ